MHIHLRSLCGLLQQPIGLYCQSRKDSTQKEALITWHAVVLCTTHQNVTGTAVSQVVKLLANRHLLCKVGSSHGRGLKLTMETYFGLILAQVLCKCDGCTCTSIGVYCAPTEECKRGNCVIKVSQIDCDGYIYIYINTSTR